MAKKKSKGLHNSPDLKGELMLVTFISTENYVVLNRDEYVGMLSRNFDKVMRAEGWVQVIDGAVKGKKISKV